MRRGKSGDRRPRQRTHSAASDKGDGGQGGVRRLRLAPPEEEEERRANTSHFVTKHEHGQNGGGLRDGDHGGAGGRCRDCTEPRGGGGEVDREVERGEARTTRVGFDRKRYIVRFAELRLCLIQELIFVRKPQCSAGISIALPIQHGPCRISAAGDVRNAVAQRRVPARAG